MYLYYHSVIWSLSLLSLFHCRFWSDHSDTHTSLYINRAVGRCGLQYIRISVTASEVTTEGGIEMRLLLLLLRECYAVQTAGINNASVERQFNDVNSKLINYMVNASITGGWDTTKSNVQSNGPIQYTKASKGELSWPQDDSDSMTT